MIETNFSEWLHSWTISITWDYNPLFENTKMTLKLAWLWRNNWRMMSWERSWNSNRQCKTWTESWWNLELVINWSWLDKLMKYKLKLPMLELYNSSIMNNVMANLGCFRWNFRSKSNHMIDKIISWQWYPQWVRNPSLQIRLWRVELTQLSLRTLSIRCSKMSSTILKIRIET